MGRRWIVAGLVLGALVATLAVLVLGPAEPPYPAEVWRCATTGELRVTPQGETLRDLSFVVLPSAGPHDAAHLRAGIHRAPTLAQRLIAPFNGGRFKFLLVPVRDCGVTETAGGLTWERYELDPPPATQR